MLGGVIVTERVLPVVMSCPTKPERKTDSDDCGAKPLPVIVYRVPATNLTG